MMSSEAAGGIPSVCGSGWLTGVVRQQLIDQAVLQINMENNGKMRQTPQSKLPAQETKAIKLLPMKTCRGCSSGEYCVSHKSPFQGFFKCQEVHKPTLHGIRTTKDSLLECRGRID